MRRALFLFMVCVFPLFSVGSVCKTEPKSREEAIRVFNLTGKVIDFLESNNAELAFVARKNKENHGISYTHLGMAWKDEQGKWVVTNLLQNCENPDELGTYDDGMALFFAPVSIYDSLILIPSKETQTELKDAIKNKEIEKFKGNVYSINANAWSDKYQNCVQYVLEAYVYVKSGKKVKTRRDAINWTKINGFRPQKIKVNLLERSLGPLVAKNVHFDDHKDRKKPDEIEVATAETVMQFIQKLESESTFIEIKE